MPTTTVPCSNTAKTRNPLKFAGVPQTTAPISAASGPKFTILCRHVEEILLLNKFFLIVDMCLSCKRYSPTSCAMVPRWRFLATFVTCILQRAARNMFQTCILNSRYGHTICGSMVDIQSPTAEIRRGKDRRTAWKYNGLPYYIRSGVNDRYRVWESLYLFK